jgi:hypothetical protein
MSSNRRPGANPRHSLDNGMLEYMHFLVPYDPVLLNGIADGLVSEVCDREGERSMARPGWV